MPNLLLWARGSSPHTRGALRNVAHNIPLGRIIPAYAGSTAGPRGRRRRRGDHPRIRGEHGGGVLVDVPGAVDHPRIRGEHVGWAWEGVKLVGSSPHTRGAHAREHQTRRVHGIIPAYAGSTSGASDDGRPVRDHPRIRGEHDLPTAVGKVTWGSSPHTRGAPGCRGSSSSDSRIIPAYAGSTRSEYSIIVPFRDHPRIRGEHFPVDVDGVGFRRSSPHTRGAPAEDRLGHLMCRIIPAYAGSTPARGQRHTTPGGSSPHTRGAHPSMKPSTLHPRIIPAYAGSTG